MPNYVLAISIIICGLQSVSKGWASLFLFPFFFIIAPITIFLQRAANRRNAVTRDKLIFDVQWAQLITLLLLYICMVGFGDTQEVFLFGFISSTTKTPITTLSSILSQIGLYGVFILTPLLAVLLVKARRNRTKSTK